MTEDERKEALIDQCNRLSESGVPFTYQMTKGEIQWAYHVLGHYGIADYIFQHSNPHWVVTFDDAEGLSRVLDGDAQGMGKAPMLSDETDLQLIMFHLYRESEDEEE